MKIAVYGGHSFIASQVIPHLQASGLEVINVSLDAHEASKLEQVDAVIFMGSKSKSQSTKDSHYETANVVDPAHAMRLAKSAGIPHFILLSSSHLYYKTTADKYLNSRREAEQNARSNQDIKVSILRLAAIYGDDYQGKLSIIKKVPSWTQGTLLYFLKALWPTTHAKRASNAICNVLSRQENNYELLAVTDSQSENGIYNFLKRSLDILAAISIIVLLSWFFVIIWIAIKLDSKGPAIFAQERVGKYIKTFTCYKFRTMYVGTVQAGSHEVGSSHVTKIGQFLRRTKADELPQVINLLRGEMSLIGPRPCLPTQSEVIEERRARGVFNVLPGISGWSQIQDIDMSTPKLVSMKDQEYVALRSLFFDVSIIISTLKGRGQGDRTGPR